MYNDCKSGKVGSHHLLVVSRVFRNVVLFQNNESERRKKINADLIGIFAYTVNVAPQYIWQYVLSDSYVAVHLFS